ncbi:MAG: hypothetical protein R3C14_10070 [Caldilineaceae bacterium]
MRQIKPLKIGQRAQGAPAAATCFLGEEQVMANKGEKENGKKQQKKKPKLTLKEKRKLKQEKEKNK